MLTLVRSKIWILWLVYGYRAQQFVHFKIDFKTINKASPSLDHSSNKYLWVYNIDHIGNTFIFNIYPELSCLHWHSRLGSDTIISKGAVNWQWHNRLGRDRIISQSNLLGEVPRGICNKMKEKTHPSKYKVTSKRSHGPALSTLG